MKKWLWAAVPLFFSFLFVGFLRADCGEPHGPSEVTTPSEPSTAPSIPSTSGDGSSTSDQLGKTFDPKAGEGGLGPLIPPGSEGGKQDPSLSAFKKYSKNAPEMKDLKKLEQQVNVDKKNTQRARGEANQALHDLSDARLRVNSVEVRLRDDMVGEKKDRLIGEFKEAVREDWTAEQNSEAKQKAFNDALSDPSSSKGDLNRAKNQAGEALQDFAKARREAQKVQSTLENAHSNVGYDTMRRQVGRLQEAVRAESQAEFRSEEKMKEFNESIDRFSETKNRYEATKSNMGIK